MPQAFIASTANSSIDVFSGSLRSTHAISWFDVSRSNCSRREFSASARAASRTPARSVT
jgi:hypothetical protein